MSHFVVDDSEVIIGHQEEIAGAMEREGSLQNRGEKESWLADTEPYRGARPRMRDFDRLVDEELGATAGEVEDSGNSPTMVLEETVGRLQRDLEELQLENRFLKTPKAVKSVPLVRQAAFTTTKVPWFDGSTSWEQYLQVFEAIVLSNGWGDATAALQLLSHLQGDALSVALLTPLPLQATRKELTDALSSHYGSPGRLANYRREFDKTVREMGEDPSNFAIKLETLAVKAFGNMGQVAQLRLIRDRFIAGHANCDLRRYLDCVPPDTPLSSRGGTYGKHDSMSDLSSDGRNSDIAAMSDFSEEEDEAWEEVGPCEDVQPNIRTDWVGEDTINSGEHSVLLATPTEVTHNVMEHHDEDYWTNFRLLAKQAFKLDDVKLAASSYPDAVKELVVRSRLTIENYPSADDDSDSALSDYECPLNIEYKGDWQYNTYTNGAEKRYYTNNAEGHDLTLEMEIEDKMDVCSEPDARAKFELSPTKPVVALDNIGVNCIADGDVTVIRGNVDGDSDTHEDEFIRVSMISVDETRRGTSVDIHNSLGTRDCVIPECVTQPTLVAYGDSTLCNKESLQIMRKYCFGLCGSTNQFHSTEFEWCVECVNRLIWGFLVSCVVSIVMRNRSVGTDVFSKVMLLSVYGVYLTALLYCVTQCVSVHGD